MKGEIINQDQTWLIHNTNWDVLIILDSCRYDYLARIVPSAQKVISPAGRTERWIRATFPDYYPFIYISAMPWIAGGPVKGYAGLEHFKNVIEVWNFGWDYELLVTLPEAVVKTYFDEAYPGNTDRIIVHFGQPHVPYIGKPPLLYKGDQGGYDKLVKDLSTGQLAVRKLRKAYFGNVKLAWEYAKMIIDNSKNKRLIVTADHGEKLMEPNSSEPHFGHQGELCPQLVNVPWVEVDTK